MQKIHVPDMACGHCSHAITEALKALDPTADVQVNLDTKMVTVDTRAAEAAVRAAIAEAGYTPS
jgi:copper chaperone